MKPRTFCAQERIYVVEDDSQMRDQTTVFLYAAMPSFFAVPSSIAAFNSHFPIKTNPPIIPIGKTRVTTPTLWILPPRPESLLSGDVVCLKWQAYLAFRGIKGIKVRWDIAPEGSIRESLPNLHVPDSEGGSENATLLAAHSILVWVDTKLGVDSTASPLEGYKDEETKTESRAWVSLLEGVIHAALVSVQSHMSHFIFVFMLSSLFPNHLLHIGDLFFSRSRCRHLEKVCKKSYPHLQHILQDYVRSSPPLEFGSTQPLLCRDIRRPFHPCHNDWGQTSGSSDRGMSPFHLKIIKMTLDSVDQLLLTRLPLHTSIPFCMPLITYGLKFPVEPTWLHGN